jgi:hypothetical protein
MTTSFISVAEFQAASPDVDTSRFSDTTISGMLIRATAIAENFLEYSLAFETVVGEKAESFIDSDGDLIIQPRKRPIRSLSSAAIVKANFNANLTLSDGNGSVLYDIPATANEIIIPSSSIALNTVSVLDFDSLRFIKFFTNITYDAGYYLYDRPADIVDAINLIARDMFTRTLNTSGAKKISQGSVSIEFSQRDGKSDNQLDAENILQSYKRVASW